MRNSKYYYKFLTDIELIEEWESRGFKDFYESGGYNAGYGWSSMDSVIDYGNCMEEMKARNFL